MALDASPSPSDVSKSHESQVEVATSTTTEVSTYRADCLWLRMTPLRPIIHNKNTANRVRRLKREGEQTDMKESLAARQAALLRQNAELNERVEAIEYRRQQQITVSLSSSSSLLQSAARLSDAGDDENDLLSDDVFHSDMEATTGGSNRATRAPPPQMSLKMDLSASIDSFGSKAEQGDEPHETGSPDKRNASKEQEEDSKGRQRVKRQGSADEAKLTQNPSQSSNNNSSSNRRATMALSGNESPDGLGLEATVRYQKARLRVLQDEADSANSHVKELQASQSVLKAQMDDLKTENGVLAKKCQQTQQLLDKQRELSTAQEAKQRILESQLAAAQAKTEETQRSEKQASQQFRSKDVRLNRALEELEKVKAQLQDERRAHDQEMITKSEFEAVVKENKKLEKHKSELLVAFKKQMKLIDLLKRQRIHMEAAKMLSFTEEEFSKTLELG